jgi:hypothetical protein
MNKRILQEFCDRVDRGDFNDDIKITLKISGGMPHERVEEQVRLSGSNRASVMDLSALKAETTVELDRVENQELFQKVRAGLDGLVPRSEARFLPDSLIGSITITVNGEEEILYFLADERERISQNKPIVPGMVEAISQLQRIQQRLQTQ